MKACMHTHSFYIKLFIQLFKSFSDVDKAIKKQLLIQFRSYKRKIKIVR